MPEAEIAARVLIVDDDPTMRLLTAATLEAAGFEVIEASDGDAGLRCFAEQQPDLVLLDVEMPGIDGFEVCRRLRQVADAALLPIVMVTGRDDLASISLAYEAGATDFLAKPINWPMLGHRVRYVLRGALTLRALDAAQARNAAMLQAIPDRLLTLAGDGRVLALQGLPHEPAGPRIDDLLPPAAAGLMKDALQRAMQGGETAVCRYALPGAEGEQHFEARVVRVADDEALGLVRDITVEHHAELQMRQALVVFNASKQGIMITTAEGIISAVNPAFSTITGYSAAEALGHKTSMLSSGRHDDAFYREMWSALARAGHWEGEIWNRRRNGEIYPQWLSISAVRNAEAAVSEYVSLLSDISERKQHEEAIWRQANFDALTGLANRSLLGDRLERALSRARRNEQKVGLIFIDLDGFKWINDALGHDVGDRLLVEVAQRIKSCIRDQDTAARLGGDEFTVVIQDLELPEDMLPIAEKVIAALREPFALAGRQQPVTGSAGITVFPDDGDDVQALLRNADIAMYKAKQAGKNRFQFYARHMQVDAQARIELEADLRAALAERVFLLHYQPIVDADSGELVGAEALIRWPHPQRGLISPLDFIPIAEDCGLIVPIGEWALREAARQSACWREQGLPPLRLSVNVSGVQFREHDLADLIGRILTEHRVDPASLVLEITESVLMDSSPEAQARIRAIKAIGVGYAIDDFGTGFSSLSYLKRFPVDFVKIDRSFVNDCPHDHNDAHLVEAIINMAHSLGLRVTAEGVETQAQVDFLRDHGCDTLQGYLISRPLPAAAFAELMRHPHLLPSGGASREQNRLLAALRNDNLDVDDWLNRLIAERSPGLASEPPEEWVCGGLDLKRAIRMHLAWRRQLHRLAASSTGSGSLSAEEARAVDRCALGAWILEQDAATPCFVRLDRAHREFHELAGRILADLAHGQRGLARRMLTGVRFRTASRDVVVALIDCYRSQHMPDDADSTAAE